MKISDVIIKLIESIIREMKEASEQCRKISGDGRKSAEEVKRNIFVTKTGIHYLENLFSAS